MAFNRQPADERRWQRREVDVPLHVVADNLAGTGVILGRGTKISEGGICLFALANLAIGAHIDVELIAAHCDAPIRVSGIVRNRVVYLYGIEFLIDQQKDRQRISELRHIFAGVSGRTTDFRSS